MSGFAVATITVDPTTVLVATAILAGLPVAAGCAVVAHVQAVAPGNANGAPGGETAARPAGRRGIEETARAAEQRFGPAGQRESRAI